MKNLNLAVVELHEKGLSYNQIAKELGISKSKAYRIINETQNVSDNETKVERSVSKVFQNIPKQVEETKDSKKYNAESLKLQVKLRKLELEHEAKMKLLEFEEKEKQRDFELKRNIIFEENKNLKSKIESFKERITFLENLDQDDYEEESEETIEEENENYIPKMDILVVDDICDLFSEIIETEKFYLEDIEKLVSKVLHIKSNILDWAENEPIEISDILEFDLLIKVKNVISDYQENFDSYRSFFGSTINMEFEEDLFSKMEDYIIQNSGK